MRKYSMIALLLLQSSFAMPGNAGPVEDVLEPLRRGVEQAYNSKNWNELTRFYTTNALHFGGSQNELAMGSDELLAAFSTERGS